jgi:hypothetical protein
LPQLPSHIPGQGAGDNVASLWNFWWMRFALARDLDLFRSDFLFAPNGTSLALHTHVALPALSAATILRALPLVTAYNLVILATIFLNAICSYALLRRLTGEWLPSVVAAVVFAGSPFMSAHLNGHLNVLSAWTLPLVAIAAMNMTTGSRRWAVLTGVLCGATVYLDYYYTIYAVVLTVAWLTLVSRPVTITVRPSEPITRPARIWLVALIVLDAAAVMILAVTGGFDVQIGATAIRAHDPFNALQLLWVLIGLWAWLHWRPRFAQTNATPAPSGLGRALGLAIVAAVVVAAPLVLRIVWLMIHGDYVSQTTYWRSGAQGIDLATLFLGNPFSHWYGGWTRAAYARLTIDAVERSAWFGVIPLGLAIVGLRSGDRRWAIRWLVIGAVALLWSLGPHLTILGQNTGMILPQAVLRYLPILSNARIPGRALVIVYLALAVLSGLGLSYLRRCGLGLLGSGALFALLTIDFVPSPFPLLALDHPPIYDRLRERPETGAVCILPVGVRDGFGESGALDHRVLFYQSIHERPMIGGFVARLAPSIRRTYDSDPLVSALLRLSTGAHGYPADLPDRTTAGHAMQTLGLRFVILDRSRASSDLVRYVEEQLPLKLVADDGAYSLFVLPEE